LVNRNLRLTLWADKGSCGTEYWSLVRGDPGRVQPGDTPSVQTKTQFDYRVVKATALLCSVQGAPCLGPIRRKETAGPCHVLGPGKMDSSGTDTRTWPVFAAALLDKPKEEGKTACHLRTASEDPRVLSLRRARGGLVERKRDVSPRGKPALTAYLRGFKGEERVVSGVDEDFESANKKTTASNRAVDLAIQRTHRPGRHRTDA